MFVATAQTGEPQEWTRRSVDLFTHLAKSESGTNVHVRVLA
jgi:hypothetical protein